MSIVVHRVARLDESTAAGPGAGADWERACIETFGLEPHTAVGRAATTLVRLGGRLEHAGPRQLFEPSDFRCESEADREAALDQVAATGYPVALLRVPTASPTIAALRRRYRVVLVRDADACPFIELEGEPEQLLAKRLREDLRRAARKAARLGDVEATVHEPSSDEADALLDTAFDVEQRSWKGRTGTALALDAGRAAFYRRYARSAAADGKLRVALLEIAGEAAAMQIAVEQDGAFWLLKIGYDERFAQASPGQLLLLETLRWSSARGLARYEFLGKAADWTRAWTQRERPCSTVYAYPASGRGAVRLARDAAAALQRWRP